jgi:hypothetical protein
VAIVPCTHCYLYCLSHVDSKKKKRKVIVQIDGSKDGSSSSEDDEEEEEGSQGEAMNNDESQVTIIHLYQGV